ncbi:MAG TPA: phage holin family protein [Candidatus Binataceae bacterium]|nr:phage holin family protein [Candidatus Binataceae bacterium]
MTSRPPEHQPSRPDSGDIGWPVLAERVIDDLTRVIRVEIQLFQNSLIPLFTDLTDRVVASLIAGFAMLAGGVAMLAAVIMFLRQWLPWWQSLAIGGAAAILAGFVLSRFAARPTDHRDPPGGENQSRSG